MDGTSLVGTFKYTGKFCRDDHLHRFNIHRALQIEETTQNHKGRKRKKPLDFF